MKTPTWAYIIGVLMMLFGGCSLNSSLQSINSPKYIEMQKNMVDDFSDGFESATRDTIQIHSKDSLNKPFQKMSENMKEMFHVSNFTQTWIVRFGYLGVGVALIYMLGGIFLMIRKPFSLKIAYFALGLSALFSLTQTIILSSDSSGSFISMTAGYSKMFGVIVDAILLVVILASDKSDYNIDKENVV